MLTTISSASLYLQSNFNTVLSFWTMYITMQNFKPTFIFFKSYKENDNSLKHENSVYKGLYF